jgi:hypothetical protein
LAEVAEEAQLTKADQGHGIKVHAPTEKSPVPMSEIFPLAEVSTQANMAKPAHGRDNKVHAPTKISPTPPSDIFPLAEGPDIRKVATAVPRRDKSHATMAHSPNSMTELGQDVRRQSRPQRLHIQLVIESDAVKTNFGGLHSSEEVSMETVAISQPNFQQSTQAVHTLERGASTDSSDNSSKSAAAKVNHTTVDTHAALPVKAAALTEVSMERRSTRHSKLQQRKARKKAAAADRKAAALAQTQIQMAPVDAGGGDSAAAMDSCGAQKGVIDLSHSSDSDV